MKNIILAVTLLAICSFNSSIGIAAQTQEFKKEAGYISLNGSKEIEVEPNIAKITFAVENIGNDAQKATTENNTISNNIITALKQITNSEDDVIKTTNFSVRPVYSTQGGKRTIKNYTAVNSVTVETKDILKVSKLIDTAISNGSNRVNGLSYGFDGEKKVCTDLYPELIKDLKTQANVLALAAGTSLDGLKHMNASCNMDSFVSNGRFYAKNASFDATVGESTSTPVEAGKVKIRVYVNADFYVK